MFTLKEIAAHSSADSVWLLIENGVYDLSKFLNEHPGNLEFLLEWGGKDATEAFEDICLSADARDLMKNYKIGDLCLEERKEKKQVNELSGKRKLDNFELEDTTLSSDDQKNDCNKNNIEKIIFQSTNKKIEAFLSYSNEQKQNTTHKSATDKLIERINLYTAEKKDAQYYLVIDCTYSFVDIAYLALLHYDEHKFWKLDIIPLINYDLVEKQERSYLRNQLDYINTDVWGAKMCYDTNIKSVCFEQFLEYAKLRIKYLKLNLSNLQQYMLELNSIKLAELSICEACKNTRTIHGDNKYLEAEIKLK